MVNCLFWFGKDVNKVINRSTFILPVQEICRVCWINVDKISKLHITLIIDQFNRMLFMKRIRVVKNDIWIDLIWCRSCAANK
jgi:hypothetical protein